MKTLISFHHLVYRIYIPIIIILAVAAIFLPQYLSYGLSVCFFFLVLWALLCIYPFKKIILGQGEPNIFYALGKIIAIQIAFVIIFLTVCFAYINFIPIPMDRAGVTSQAAWQITIKEILLWGLFPWSCSALMAIVMAYQGHKDKSSNILQSLSVCLKKERHGILGLGGELFVRQGLIFLAGVTLGALSLTWYFWLCKLLKLTPILGTNLGTLLLFTFVNILTRLDPWQQSLIYLWRKNFSIGQLLILQAIILTVGLLLLTPVMQLIVQNLDLPSLDKSLNFLKKHPWYYPWQLFTWAWWLTTIPLSAHLFASIISGLSLRKSLWILLIFPIFMAIFSFFYLNETAYWLSAHLFNIYTGTKIIPYLIFWAGSLILIAYLVLYKHYGLQLLTATYKDKRSVDFKKRLPLKISNGVLQVTILIIMLYLLGGLFLISRFYFAVVATGIVVYGVISVGFIKQFLYKKGHA